VRAEDLSPAQNAALALLAEPGRGWYRVGRAIKHGTAQRLRQLGLVERQERRECVRATFGTASFRVDWRMYEVVRITDAGRALTTR
jgi:hypothetical protein